MTPLDLARTLARSTTLDGQALGVGIVLRGLTDYSPSDPYRDPWPLTVTTAARAASYLGLDPTPELLVAALDVAPTISDAMLNR
jgi:hypothetical protein